ncbi:MAG: uracil phosphoribosyltransferase [Chitinophagales bacterium]
MLVNLGETDSLINAYIRELRDIEIQQDRMRFRKNLHRIGNIMAYEISRTLEWASVETTTQLGISETSKLKSQPVLATILRAGIPLHEGLLDFFDQAENAFIAAYRKHDKDGSFTISAEYLTSPDIEGKVLIISDPMLATGASMIKCLKKILLLGKPKAIHIVTAIASKEGIYYVSEKIDCSIWTAAIDEELTAKSYIVPGLGDAGDLAFGEKTQE